MISIMKSMSGFRKQAKYFATDTTVIRRYWMVGPDIVSQEDFVRVDLSRFRAAPSARLSHFPFESDGAFPAQC
jgi:hypothetical protein